MAARGACRKADKCSGHSGHKPRPCVQGSPDVMINSRPAHRKGDKWGPHHHTSVLAKGSTTVFTNSRQQGRIGDPIVCKSRVAQGSFDVLIGD